MSLARWLTLEDVLAAARAIAAGPETDLRASAREIVARAAVARVWRRTRRAAHPRYGDGSLTGASGRAPSHDGASLCRFLHSVAALCLELAATEEAAGRSGGAGGSAAGAGGEAGGETFEAPGLGDDG
ncbi:MAG: hypothetical protein EA355_08585 [Rhodobacteraceae bacterium]|nr:MAG: hypothetical protein EA355_08585 [Paracoccaceae bacterium]